MKWTAEYYQKLTDWLEAASGKIYKGWVKSPFAKGGERAICDDVANPRVILTDDEVGLAMLHPHPYVVSAAGLNYRYTSLDQFLHMWNMANLPDADKAAILANQAALAEQAE